MDTNKLNEQKYLVLRLPTNATKRAQRRSHSPGRDGSKVALYLRRTTKAAYDLRDQLVSYDYRSRVYAVVDGLDGRTVVSSNGMKWRV